MIYCFGYVESFCYIIEIPEFNSLFLFVVMLSKLPQQQQFSIVMDFLHKFIHLLCSWWLRHYQLFVKIQLLQYMNSYRANLLQQQSLQRQLDNSPFYGPQDISKQQAIKLSQSLFTDEDYDSQLKKYVSFAEKIKSNMKAAHIRTTSVLSDITKHLTLFVNQCALFFFLQPMNQLSGNGAWRQLGTWLFFSKNIKAYCADVLSFIEGKIVIGQFTQSFTGSLFSLMKKMPKPYTQLMDAIKQQIRCLQKMGDDVFKKLTQQKTEDQFSVFSENNSIIHINQFQSKRKTAFAIINNLICEVTQLVNVSSATSNQLKQTVLSGLSSIIQRRKETFKTFNDELAQLTAQIMKKKIPQKRRTFYKYHILIAVFLVSAKLHQIQCDIFQKFFQKTQKITNTLRFGFLLNNQDYSSLLRRALEMNFYNFFANNTIGNLATNTTSLQNLTPNDKKQFARKCDVFKELTSLLIAKSAKKNIQFIMEQSDPVKYIVKSIARKGIDLQNTFQILTQQFQKFHEEEEMLIQQQRQRVNIDEKVADLANLINQVQQNSNQIVSTFSLVPKYPPNDQVVASSVRLVGAGVNKIGGSSIQSPYILESIPQYNEKERLLIVCQLQKDYTVSLEICKQQFSKLFQTSQIKKQNQQLQAIKNTNDMKQFFKALKEEFIARNLEITNKTTELKDIVTKNVSISEQILKIVTNSRGDVQQINSNLELLFSKYNRTTQIVDIMSGKIASKDDMNQMMNQMGRNFQMVSQMGRNLTNVVNNNQLALVDTVSKYSGGTVQKSPQKAVKEMFEKLKQLKQKNDSDFNNKLQIKQKISAVKVQLQTFRRNYESQIDNQVKQGLYGKKLGVAVEKAIIFETNIIQIADLLKNNKRMFGQIQKQIQTLAQNNVNRMEQYNSLEIQNSEKFRVFAEAFQRGKKKLYEKIKLSHQLASKNASDIVKLSQNVEEHKLDILNQVKNYQDQLFQMSGQQKQIVLNEIHGFFSQIQGIKHLVEKIAGNNMMVSQNIYGEVRMMVINMDKSLHAYVENLNILEQEFKKDSTFLTETLGKNINRLGQTIQQGIQTLVNNGNQQAVSNYAFYRQIFFGVQSIHNNIQQGFSQTLRWQLYLGHLMTSGIQQSNYNQALTFHKLGELQEQMHQSMQQNFVIRHQNTQLRTLLVLAIGILNPDLDVASYQQKTATQIFQDFQKLIKWKNDQVNDLSGTNTALQTILQQILDRCQVNRNRQDWKQVLFYKLDGLATLQQRKAQQIQALNYDLNERQQRLASAYQDIQDLKSQIRQNGNRLTQLTRQINLAKKQIQLTNMQKQQALRNIQSMKNSMKNTSLADDEEKDMLQKRAQDLDFQITQYRGQIAQLKQQVQQLRKYRAMHFNNDRKQMQNQENSLENVPQTESVEQNRVYQKTLTGIIKQRKDKCLFAKKALNAELQGIQTLIELFGQLKGANKRGSPIFQKYDSKIKLLKNLREKINMTIKEFDAQITGINKIAAQNKDIIDQKQRQIAQNKKQIAKLQSTFKDKQAEARQLKPLLDTYQKRLAEILKAQSKLIAENQAAQQRIKKIIRSMESLDIQAQTDYKALGLLAQQIQGMNKNTHQRQQHMKQIFQQKQYLLDMQIKNRDLNLTQKVRIFEELELLKVDYQHMNERFLAIQKQKKDIQMQVQRFRLQIEHQQKIRSNRSGYISTLQRSIVDADAKVKLIYEEKQLKIKELERLIQQNKEKQLQIKNNRKLMIIQQRYLQDIKKMHQKDRAFVKNIIQAQQQFQKLLDRIDFKEQIKNNSNLTEEEKIRIKQNQKQIQALKARMKYDKKFIMAFNSGLLAINQQLRQAVRTQTIFKGKMKQIKQIKEKQAMQGARQMQDPQKLEKQKMQAKKEQQARLMFRNKIERIQNAYDALKAKRQLFLKIIDTQEDDVQYYRRYDRKRSQISQIRSADQRIQEDSLLIEDQNKKQTLKKVNVQKQKSKKDKQLSKIATNQQMSNQQLTLSVMKFCFTLLENVIRQDMQLIIFMNQLIVEWEQMFEKNKKQRGVVAGIVQVFEGIQEFVQQCLLAILQPFFADKVFKSHAKIGTLWRNFHLNFGNLIKEKAVSIKKPKLFNAKIDKKFFLIQ